MWHSRTWGRGEPGVVLACRWVPQPGRSFPTRGCPGSPALPCPAGVWVLGCGRKAAQSPAQGLTHFPECPDGQTAAPRGQGAPCTPCPPCQQQSRGTRAPAHPPARLIFPVTAPKCTPSPVSLPASTGSHWWEVIPAMLPPPSSLQEQLPAPISASQQGGFLMLLPKLPRGI